MRLETIGGVVVGFGLLAGCVSPEPVALLHPDYRPAEIRRPAVLLQVSLDQTGFGDGEFSREERASLPDQLAAALIDGLNSQGLFPLDVAMTAQRADRGTSNPLERLDLAPALARARSLRADVLVVVDMRLGWRDVLYCRDTRRPFRARSTVLAVTLEVLRVSDGTLLLLEPPTTDPLLTDLEAECGPERSVHRLSIQELTEAAVSRAVTRLLRR